MRRRATAVVIRHGRVLLVKDKEKHHFSLPGGGIHRGEPILSAAIQELYEETGLTATKASRLRDCDFTGSFSQHKVVLIEAKGRARIRGKELRGFLWWDRKKPIPTLGHVNYILGKLHNKTPSC